MCRNLSVEKKEGARVPIQTLGILVSVADIEAKEIGFARAEKAKRSVETTASWLARGMSA